MKSTATALVALVVASGCAVSPPDDSLKFRSGTGVVQDVQPARVGIPPPQGGSVIERASRPQYTEGHQLTLRMDDGTTQRITQDSREFKAGDRVQITPDGRVLAAGTARAGSYRAGFAVVQQVQAARVAAQPGRSGEIIGSQAAGGSFGTPIERVFRRGESSDASMLLTLRMDDGSSQYVAYSGAPLQVGERVQVLPDGRVVKAATASATPGATAAQAAGFGIIESAAVASLPSGTSAAAGATGGAAAGPTMAYRIKMDDGSTRSVMQAGERLSVGDRVQVTSDGRLIRR